MKTIRNLCLATMAALLLAPAVPAQDLPRFEKMVRQLSGAKYQGRGYARDGVRKAGKYIAREFQKSGVDAVTLQPFTLDINTFSGKMEMWADGRKLKAGYDYSMREYSPGVHGEFPVYHVDTLHFNADKLFADLARPEYANCLVCCEFCFTYNHREVFAKLQKSGACTNAGLLYEWTSPIKFYKAYGEKVVDKPIIWVTPEAIANVKTVRLNVDNEFLNDYPTENVIAKVNGRRHDGCYVFTAHYDHLGNLGRKVYYPGANDNASGTAAIITLAQYYAEHQPEYDMYFVAFSGEDANLRGSTWFVEHPVVPLDQIRYLFNLDMIGDNNSVQYCEVSDAGMARYELFEKINQEQSLFKALNRGDLAANSDHYPFAVRGVPCIFLENQEGDAFPYYHTPADNMKTIRLDSYIPVFKLVTSFVEKDCLND
ncbi:MAG: Zn-dependent exopeptidase M28 [Bacteroidales bacterium]|nr:Zn-dependent exopeptidase M28 [Bacteroidales bacterium]